jgi:hypothetical protein
MMKKIVFFNQFHNGDCFVGKGYIQAIVRALPGVEFEYAHGNHVDIIKDLPVRYIPLDQIPAIGQQTRVAESEDKQTVYINTWVGCWQGALFPFGEHINNQRLHAVWSKYFEYLNLPIGNAQDYLPEIDFTAFDTDAAANFVQASQARNEKIVIFANGSANSGQSRVGDFRSVIERLAKDYPGTRFLLTASIDSLSAPNIYYANEVMPLASNLNQIAYVSQFSEMIIGKNSGPFTWCQFKSNLLDPDRTFFNFSILPTDCPSGGSRYLARCLFSPVTDDNRIYELIRAALMQPNYRGTEFLV